MSATVADVAGPRELAEVGKGAEARMSRPALALQLPLEMLERETEIWMEVDRREGVDMREGVVQVVQFPVFRMRCPSCRPRG